MKTVMEGKWIRDGRGLVADSVCIQIESMIRTFTPVGSGDAGWTQVFRDPATGVFWELTYPNSDLHGGGPPRLESLAADEVQLRYPNLV